MKAVGSTGIVGDAVAPARFRPARKPRLIVPCVEARCPAGHGLRVPVEYATGEHLVFCPSCRKRFRMGADAVRAARHKAEVGIPRGGLGEIHVEVLRRRAERRRAARTLRAGRLKRGLTAPLHAIFRTCAGGGAMFRRFLRRRPAAVAPAAAETSALADRPAIPVTPRMFSRLFSASTWAASCALHAAVLLAILLLMAAGRMPARPGEVLAISVARERAMRQLVEPEPLKRRSLFGKAEESDRLAQGPDEQPVDSPIVKEDQEAEVENIVDGTDGRDLSQRGLDLTDLPLLPVEAVSGARLSGSSVGLGSRGGGRAGGPAGFGPEIFANRGSPEKRLAAARRGGGGEDTENAVEKALKWLAEHQSADGAWREQSQQPLRAHATTALATLAFLGAGYNQHQGKYKDTVSKALDFLISGQSEFGCWTHPPNLQEMHAQGVATLALAEACYLTTTGGRRDDRLRAAAQRAVDYVVDAQIPYSGWGYSPYSIRKKGDATSTVVFRPTGVDLEQSVVIWNGMALQAAKMAGLKVDGVAFLGMTTWLDDSYLGRGMYAYAASFEGKRVVIYGKKDDSGGYAGSITMACAGLMMRLWTGTRPDAESSRLTAERILAFIESEIGQFYFVSGQKIAFHPGAPLDLYFLHHGSIAMFQMGGEAWTRWNKSMKSMVLASQISDGSWRPFAYIENHAMATAFGALVLESYYRYSPLYR